MANHKSALKRGRQSEERRQRNKMVKTRVRGAVKNAHQAVEAGGAEAAAQALKSAVPVIDKAAAKGVIHPRTASRKISRLAKAVHKLAAAKPAA